MSDPQILPVILSGGSGTRLWPLSRRDLPKQFVPLVDGKSLLQLTLERARLISPSMLLVASEAHRFLVQEAVEAAGVDARVLLEPVGRNTAAAMAAACLYADTNACMLFLPADHHIPDAAALARTINEGVASALAGHIVTFGVVPTFPSTAYGYIRAGQALAGLAPARAVDLFVEKPDREAAEKIMLQGGHFWNAGVFLARRDILMEALATHAPDILEACRVAVSTQQADGNFVRLGKEAFERARSQSIDYAVMEHSRDVAVVPFEGAWSDVGSWNAVAGLTAADAEGNRVHGNGFCVESRNTYIHAPQRPVVALGVSDLLVIDSQDALLVADASHAEQVRQVVDLLLAAGVPQATAHRHVSRPWGSYDSLDVGHHFQVKRLTVKPGGRLSLQLHHRRAEHWIVVAGTARVTCGERVFDLERNQSTYIPLGERHRLENPGATLLEVIEIQSGEYLGEDDIVRFEDNYGRA